MDESDLIAHAFSDPLIAGEQVYGPLRSLGDIHERNCTLLLPVDRFFAAYDNLQVVDSEELALDQGKTALLRLVFRLGEKEYDAYACTPRGARTSSCAALFISSSGNNSIAAGEFDRVVPALDDLVDAYLFVKPNEDWLAFHNGKGKLHRNYYVNWLLNRGSSHSASYIIASMAVTKYLQSTYDKVVVAGCSQGGAAALLNALQSQPDAAIIASGCSVMFDKVLGSGHNQIILPGLDAEYSPEAVRDRIHQGSTSYLFTYGKTDNASYAYEAEKGLTFSFMAGPNFTGLAHGGGHDFPAREMRDFVQAELRP